MAAQSAKLDKDESRRRILAAAVELLGSSGLTDWTVESVASKAGCAKGLVLYHFGSKQALLDQVATEVTTSRGSSRITALRLPPAKAIDRLWEVLSQEVTSGALPTLARPGCNPKHLNCRQLQHITATATRHRRGDDHSGSRRRTPR